MKFTIVYVCVCVCVCVWGVIRTNNTLILSFELVKVGGYDFPHPCDSPRNSHLSIQRPLYALSLTCLI
jgi:hypothetical protein